MVDCKKVPDSSGISITDSACMHMHARCHNTCSSTYRLISHDTNLQVEFMVRTLQLNTYVPLALYLSVHLSSPSTLESTRDPLDMGWIIMRSQYLMPCQSSFTGLDPKIWGCSQALGEDRAHACAQYPCKHVDAFIWCLIQ